MSDTPKDRAEMRALADRPPSCLSWTANEGQALPAPQPGDGAREALDVVRQKMQRLKETECQRSGQMDEVLLYGLHRAVEKYLAALHRPDAAGDGEPVAGDTASFNCQICRRECDGPGELYRCPANEDDHFAFDHLEAALRDIDISAYNAAKWRIGKALTVLRAKRSGAEPTGSERSSPSEAEPVHHEELAKMIQDIAECWKGANGGIFAIRGMSLELAKTLAPCLARPAGT